jgi:hypothetical protein
VAAAVQAAPAKGLERALWQVTEGPEFVLLHLAGVESDEILAT